MQASLIEAQKKSFGIQTRAHLSLRHESRKNDCVHFREPASHVSSKSPQHILEEKNNKLYIWFLIESMAAEGSLTTKTRVFQSLEIGHSFLETKTPTPASQWHPPPLVQILTTQPERKANPFTTEFKIPLPHPVPCTRVHSRGHNPERTPARAQTTSRDTTTAPRARAFRQC